MDIRFFTNHLLLISQFIHCPHTYEKDSTYIAHSLKLLCDAIGMDGRGGKKKEEAKKREHGENVILKKISSAFIQSDVADMLFKE